MAIKTPLLPRRFSIVEGRPVTANGTTVVDLDDGLHQAILMPDEALTSFAELVADTRSADMLRDTDTLATRNGHRYRILAPGTAVFDLVTAGGVCLDVLPGDSGFQVGAFGAVGDGDMDARTGSDDHAAIQAAADAVGRRGGGTLIFPRGIYRLSDIVRLHSHTRVVGSGTVWNDRASYVADTINNSCSPFLIGFLALSMFGHRAVGSSDAWVPKCAVYTAQAKATRKDTSVTLQPGVAKDFKVGELVILRTQEYRLQTSTSIELQVPDESGIAKITGVNGDSLVFEHPVGFDSATQLQVCRIDGSTEGGLDFHIAENIEITGIHLVGRTAFGNNNTGAYNCRLHDSTFDCHNMIQANGFAHCSVRNLSGRFVERFCETKFCAHDSVVSGIMAHDCGTPRPVGMISIGEGSRGISLENFDIIATHKTGGQIFQLQPGQNCRFSNGRIVAPNSVNNPVCFYGDPQKSLADIIIENIRIEHGSSTHVLFSAGNYEPKRCVLRNCTFSSQAASIDSGVVFLGGQGNSITGNNLTGGFSFSGYAEMNVVLNNHTDDSGITGSSADLNYVSDNYVWSEMTTKSLSSASGPQGLRVTGVRAPATTGHGIEIDSPDSYGRLRTVDRGAGNALLPVQLHGKSIAFLHGPDTGTATEAMRISETGRMRAGGVDMLAPNGTVATKVASLEDLQNAASSMNTRDKRLGALVIDLTDLRLLFASGSAATAPWYVVDGSDSIVPT